MFIDKIIVINLDRAKERKAKLVESFNRVGVNINNVLFLSAFDGEYLNNSFERTIFGDSMGRTFAKGEICCTLSHITAIKIAKTLGYKNILILEDDIELCDDFNERIQLLENQLPQNWSQIYIGGTFNNLGERITENLYIVDKIDGTYSYMVNEKYYDTIINQLMKFSTATDGEFEILRLSENYKSYVFKPLFTYCSDIYSYICDTNRPHIMNNTKTNFIQKL